MKLGTQTGSIINHLQSLAVIGQPEPEVGQGATILSWTDRYAATVVNVFTVGKSLYVQVTHDESKVVDGSQQDGSAEYEYTSRPDGHRVTFVRESNGTWTEVYRKEIGYDEAKDERILSNRWSKTKGKGLRIGEREEYRDPSF